MQDGEVWLTQDGELAEKETRAKFTQVADNGKPINIIQDKNYQSDFDRLMAVNTTRVSNFFIEIRVVSYAENLDLLGFSVFLYFHAVFVK